ncbi:MAG: DUF4070 domain-containing protein [Methylococcaceae bacterium]|nr:DUF4070 domain-containing protein [Methylococcaceae bacterium]
MRALLIYPILPTHILYFKNTMARLGKKSSYPPVGLMTVAAMLPKSWELKLVDRNVHDITEDEWSWAELVMISAMIPQKEDLHAQVREAKNRGKPVVIGGAYSSSLPEESGSSGADYLVLNEGEITIPMFLKALEAGETKGIYRTGEKPDVSQSPIPRFDLIDFNQYASLSIQYSRGCPFLCEFCDIITLYGRKPRVKTPEQMLKEFDYIYNLGWRGVVGIIDDNFIGNKRHVKSFLIALKAWMIEKNYPFVFITEASLDLAAEKELMALMVECNFKGVFLGIETPDEDSLVVAKKSQNMRSPLIEAIELIYQAGLTITAGMVIGFDGERNGAGERIVEFLEATAIPSANFGILQALPTTALWTRLEKEQRLLSETGDGVSTKPMNFIPSRPAEDIIEEYIDANWQLYEPKKYIERIFRHCMRVNIINQGSIKNLSWQEFIFRVNKLDRRIFSFIFHVFWEHGFVLETRADFWKYLFKLAIKKPKAMMPFLFNCAIFEDLDEHRRIIREKMSVDNTDLH